MFVDCFGEGLKEKFFPVSAGSFVGGWMGGEDDMFGGDGDCVQLGLEIFELRACHGLDPQFWLLCWWSNKNESAIRVLNRLSRSSRICRG